MKARNEYLLMVVFTLLLNTVHVFFKFCVRFEQEIMAVKGLVVHFGMDCFNNINRKDVLCQGQNGDNFTFNLTLKQANLPNYKLTGQQCITK